MSESRRAAITAYLRVLVEERAVGEVLPTTVELCEKFDVAGSQTVRSAYAPLVAEGLVEVVASPRRRWVVRAHAAADPGLGEVVAAIADARAALARAAAVLDHLMGPAAA